MFDIEAQAIADDDARIFNASICGIQQSGSDAADMCQQAYPHIGRCCINMNTVRTAYAKR
jgi:hypothetical protein